MGRARTRVAFLAAVLVGLGGLCASPPATAEEAPASDASPVRLTIGDDSRLAISTFPTWSYDGRAGAGFGTLTPISPGRYRLHMDAGDIAIPALELLPGLGLTALAIDIVPRSIDGTVDLCSGEVALSFDAVFRPRFAPRMSVRVATDISTATTTVAGRTVAGAPMDAGGNLRLAGIALVPETGDFLTDSLLRLPAPAVADLEAHLHFPSPGPQPACGTAPEPAAAMTVLPGSRLLISRFAPFPYDGKGSSGAGHVTATADPDVFEVLFRPEDLTVPPLRFIPGSDAIRVDILPRSIGGTANVCTGEVDFAFDAVFQPVVGSMRPSPISVVTDLTSETSSGYFRTISGRRMDVWGDARLVGVARVPRTGDPLVDLLLSLPTDAVADLAVHLDLPPCRGAG